MRQRRRHPGYAGRSVLLQGPRASNTLVALKEAGIKNVSLYFGSWNEWSRDPSLPIEEGLPYKAASSAAAAA